MPGWCACASPIVAGKVTFWLLLHALPHRLFTAVRDHVAALVAPFAPIQMDTLRLRVLKVAAYVRQSVRPIVVHFPRAFGLAPLFRRLLDRAPSWRLARTFAPTSSCQRPSTSSGMRPRRTR